MSKNTVQPDREHMTIWRMRIACCIPKATNIHSQYAILIFFPHCNNGYANASQCYLVRTFPVLFKFQYLFFSLRSSIICLRRLPRVPVPSIFPSMTCVRRQFLSKFSPVQLAFLRFNVCEMSLFFLALYNSSFSALSVRLIFSIFLQRHISKLSRYF